jgi:hypothetical protein
VTRRSRGIATIALFALLLFGCGLTGDNRWGTRTKFIGFDPDTVNPGGPADFTVLLPLSEIFYERITARRFNSLATFEDPALREFFKTEAAFADYYAAFAEALERANFESIRPTAVRLDRIERTTPNAVTVYVTFRGENGLPLRWWSTHVKRQDQWEFSSGRWWVIPGKV